LVENVDVWGVSKYHDFFNEGLESDDPLQKQFKPWELIWTCKKL
jgi:hypothetical protein